jgi:ParB-like chromosome segregation protein Spo0J
MLEGSTVQARIHPAADLFPPMGDKEFTALASDIRTNGLRTPIVKMGDVILDGRHRYRACKETGVEPRYDEYIGADPLAYVISLNLHRRHLSEGQRAMVAARLANMPQGARTDREPSANLQKVSQRDAAKRLSVSPRSVADAKKVVKHGTPELARRVALGQLSVSLAAKIAGMPEKQQVEVAGLDQRALRRVVNAAPEEREIALPTAKQPVRDRLLWGEQQADLLRRLAAGERVHDQVEWLNVAEAIEAPGRDLRYELANRISSVLSCLVQLGLAFRGHRGRRAWRGTIGRELRVIERLLADAPGLQSTVPAVINAERAGAKAVALKTLHARKPSLFRIVEGGFLRPLLLRLAFEDPYETEMCVGWAAHEIELWASKLCLQGSKNSEASSAARR